MNKKKLENYLLAIIGVGLVITATVLLLKSTRHEVPFANDNASNAFPHYIPDDHGLHVFSESGILL